MVIGDKIKRIREEEAVAHFEVLPPLFILMLWGKPKIPQLK
jgi:hypothetical protein